MPALMSRVGIEQPAIIVFVVLQRSVAASTASYCAVKAWNTLQFADSFYNVVVLHTSFHS